MLSLTWYIGSRKHNFKLLPAMIFMNLTFNEKLYLLVQFVHKGSSWRNLIVLESLIALHFPYGSQYFIHSGCSFGRLKPYLFE